MSVSTKPQSVSLSADSFEKMGIHTNVCVALSSKGIHAPYTQQAATLTHTTRDMCDVLATVHPHTGRHTLLIAFASHCVLAANVPKYSLVVAGTPAAASKLFNVAKMLNVMGVTPYTVLDASDRTRTSGCVTPSLVITTLPTVLKWPREEFLKCASLLVEDTSQCNAKDLESVMQTVANAADPLNMFLLTTQNLTEVPATIRYALHRRRRRFCALQPIPPAYTFLLSVDHEDRLAILRKIVQIKNFKRLLVLTHSKEVKDLRMKLQQWGLNTLALGRNAAPSEQSTTIREFIASTYAVLVVSDAYSGLDILDTDAVVQYYPPQKSMDEDEWSDYVRCLRTTCHPTNPTRCITLLGTDDFTLGAYFMKRAECEGPILNVTPNHPRFADIVLNPLAVAMERVSQPLPNAIEFPTAKKEGTHGKSGTAATSASGNNNNNNNNNNNKGGMSEKERQRQKEKEKEAMRQRDREREAQRKREKEAAELAKKNAAAAAASGAGSPAASGGESGGVAELSNRAKRRLAKEEARKKQEAAVKQKEENRAREREREAQRLKEKAAREEKEKKKAAAAATTAPSSSVPSTDNSPTDHHNSGSNNVDSSAALEQSQTKSKRQLRKESYYAESKQQRLARKEKERDNKESAEGKKDATEPKAKVEAKAAEE